MGGLKELIAILCLTLPVFWIAKAPACEFAVDLPDFCRRRNLWIAISSLAFVSNNFWVYIIGAAVILAFGVTREVNWLAMFFSLMMAVPAFGRSISGVGGIQEFMHMNHLRLLSIVILLPAYLITRRRVNSLPFGRTTSDKFLLAYLALQLILQVPVSSVTNVVRYTVYSFIDVFLPYYVASRSLQHLKDYRDALTTLVLTVLLMASIAIFEYFRSWQLYAGLAGMWGIESDSFGNYMLRGGHIRAIVTSQHPIVLGYVVTVALGIFLFVKNFVSNRILVLLGLILLIGSLIASGSRGPWVGSAVVLAAVLLTGEDRLKRSTRLALLATPILIAASFTDFGEKLFSALPFIGTADTDSVEYRQVLIDTSFLVIRQNLWFGAFDYLANPAMQSLMTGDGIIDVVNTFVGVTLTYGIVGLGLFCGVFLFAARDAYIAMRHAEKWSETSLLGRSLLATLTGAMVTIVTASSVGVVPVLYWIIAGLCVGYAQLVRSTGRTTAMTEQEIQGRLAGV